MTVAEMIAALQALPKSNDRLNDVWIEIETDVLAPVTCVEYNPKFARVVIQYVPET